MQTYSYARQTESCNPPPRVARAGRNWPLQLCYAKIDAAAATVAKVIAEGRVVYGINTGFGLLASQRIPPGELGLLQRSLVLSHAAGMGEPLSEPTVRLLMTLKINSLALGYSGVGRELIEALIRLLNSEVYPCIPRKGSCGASGNLAPLAHLCLPLLGEGEVFHRGRHISGGEGLKSRDSRPSRWDRKRASHCSTALGLDRGSSKGFFSRRTCMPRPRWPAQCRSRPRWLAASVPRALHAVRGHAGQIAAAAAYR